MNNVIPMCFDASDLTHVQALRKIRELGWKYGRFNIRELQQNNRVIIVRVKYE